MSATTHSHSEIRIPGTSEHFLDPLGSEPRSHGRLRYLVYTLIGGTLAGTVLTLMFLPAMYAIWFKIKPSPAHN